MRRLDAGATISVVVALVLSQALAACQGASLTGPLEVQLNTGADGKLVFDVVHLTDAMVRAATSRELSREDWEQVLRVSVSETASPMVGSYAIRGTTLRFTPMFPLDSGRAYYAAFHAAALPGLASERSWLTASFTVPAVTRASTTTVSAIYPSGDHVPANQLRLYVHFSAPMGRKGGLEYVKLVDDTGQEVVDPFLPLDAEFWNADHTRYTVFFDPGRQKRGILPNQQMGRSLEPGRRYTLVVSKDWLDGSGLPLREDFRKTFTVGPPDERPLDVRQWRITTPAAGTREALSVAFPEPLDHGLLLRALGAGDRRGAFLDGEVAIESQEMQWRFTPKTPWQAGDYQLIALGVLEDLAGNRIGRAFEVDTFDRADASHEVDRTAVPFAIKN